LKQNDLDAAFDMSSDSYESMMAIIAKERKMPKVVSQGRELHHIVPRSYWRAIGQPVDSTPDNLVSLTIQEHFMVHYYAMKCSRPVIRRSMICAMRLMLRALSKMSRITPEQAEILGAVYGEMKSLERTRRKEYNRTGKVLCVETGEVYKSTGEAHDKTGINQGNICSCCEGRLKTAGKMHWRWCKANSRRRNKEWKK